jgi:glycosyltransferase involved in cell wall biosynthesis
MRDEAETPDEPNVIRCWRIGEDDLHDLATQVHLSDLDTLLIQFQYGFFDLVALRVFLQEMIGTGRRLFVIFHATTDTPNKSLAELRVPLRLCQRLWVHSANDEAALARIGLGENVARLPHGVIVAAPADVRIDISPDRFVLATYGFFLPHKGLLEILTAVSDLCRLGWNLHLLMVNAEYPVSVSADLIRQARRRIADLGLADRVTLITDYLPDAESLGYLRRADLIVYPYQQTGESSSAAVRMGLAARRPVAVTPLPIFDDVRDIVLTLPGIRVREMGDGLQALMADLQSDVPSESVRQTRARARRWCDDHGYPRLSAYLHQCLMETDR